MRACACGWQQLWECCFVGGGFAEAACPLHHIPCTALGAHSALKLPCPLPDGPACAFHRCCRFKTACRALGFTSWPHRRRKSVQALLDNSVDAEEDAASEVVRILQAEDEALLKQPDKKLCPNFKKLRQAYYKEKYHTNRRDGGGGGGAEGGMEDGAEAGGMEEGDAED